MKIKGFIYLATFSFLILNFSKCKEKGDTVKTINGNEIIFFHDEPTPTIKAGQYVYFSGDMYIGDSLTSLGRNNEDLHEFFATEYGKKEDPMPIVDAFHFLSPGDSVKIIHQTTEAEMLQFNTREKQYHFIVKIFAAKNDEERTIYLDSLIAVKTAKLKALEITLNKISTQIIANEKIENLITTKSQLQYKKLNSTTNIKPKIGDQVQIKFAFAELGGAIIENNILESKKYQYIFGKDMHVMGWDEGMQYLNEGEDAIFLLNKDLIDGESFEKFKDKKFPLLLYLKLVKVN